MAFELTIQPVIKCSNFAKILYNPPKDLEILIWVGGRGGMKTYEVSKAVAYNATILNKRIQVVRDEKVHVKESILNDILNHFDKANAQGAFDGLFQRQDTGIKNLKTNEMHVFTKGFRASSLNQRANLKSVSNVDIAVIEEAEDIRDEDKFNTFADSIRKQGSYIIVVLNTPDINHWIIKRFFNTIPVEISDCPEIDPAEIDGYYRIEPKKIKGVHVVQTNYDDNPYLPEKTVRQYKSYGDVSSTSYNPHYYLTSIKGFASTGLKGQIIKKYKVITLDEYLSVDATEVYGLDFGTSSPAGLLRVKTVRDSLYCDELNYEGMTAKEIGFKMSTLGFTQKSIIIADSAEPDSIRDLRFGFRQIMTEKEKELYPTAYNGFYSIFPAHKGQGSIKSGIDMLLSMNIYVTERSVNLIKEFLTYVWAVDRNGNPMDVPIDANNHLIDPLRYVVREKGIRF